ncbi:MTOR-associated protein MEAK7-like [Antedon mediterranea]|uniref:MTOR-associated protein MEAK7-like n=1 Tax=Antedon mediterranea TaxID=105859 RepID=UPI003AF56A2B
MKMGAAKSTSDSASRSLTKYNQSITLFSPEELAELKLIFHDICRDNANKNVFCEQHLKKYISGRVPDTIVSKLFMMMCDKEEYVSYENFMVSMADFIKGMVDQQASVLYTLAISEDKIFTLSSFRKVLEMFLKCYEAILKNMDVNLTPSDTTKPNQVFVDVCVQNVQDGDIKSALDVCTWLQDKPLIQTILTDIMMYCFHIKNNQLKEEQSKADSTTTYLSPLLPQLVDVNWDNFTSLLSMPSILLINHHLPHNLRHIWRLVYAVDLHGASFSTLVKKISLQGPSILLVKDKEGHVFGGFASVNWKIGPSFIGSSECFLFSLLPSMAIYESTSINEHYMYLNMDQETLPNGLGMGGQFSYFGLWLDQDFGIGHSKAQPRCTTYNSTQLSASEQYNVDMLEVWAVGDIPKVTIKEEQTCSILDKDPEARALLDIIGKERKSEGLREDPTSDIPEIHNLPPM